MDLFFLQQFSVRQLPEVFKVGTDGFLLGALCPCVEAKHVLEVGSGTGLISLMMAQRNLSAKILAIDISKRAWELTNQNFLESPFRERLRAEKKDFRAFRSTQKYDLLVSNPPYFEANGSLKNVLARQQLELTFEDLAEKSAEILDTKGKLSVIIPFEDSGFIELAGKNNLFLNKKIIIYGIKNAKPKRLVLEFSFVEKAVEIEELVIEKAPRIYSEQYIELTKEFHVFR